MARPLEHLTYSIAELAGALGIGEDLARALVASGEIPSTCINRRVLVSRKTVAAWLADHEGRSVTVDLDGAASA